jgi:hypothetical protein
MPSSSQSGNSFDPPTSKVSDLLGSFVALLTLILPLVMISHYSTSAAPERQPNPPLEQQHE